jgi:hypothetical protein
MNESNETESVVLTRVESMKNEASLKTIKVGKRPKQFGVCKQFERQLKEDGRHMKHKYTKEKKMRRQSLCARCEVAVKTKQRML